MSFRGPGVSLILGSFNWNSSFFADFCNTAQKFDLAKLWYRIEGTNWLLVYRHRMIVFYLNAGFFSSLFYFTIEEERQIEKKAMDLEFLCLLLFLGCNAIHLWYSIDDSWLFFFQCDTQGKDDNDADEKRSESKERNEKKKKLTATERREKRSYRWSFRARANVRHQNRLPTLTRRKER